MYTLTQAKDLVLNQGYAIRNDDSVEKLREVLKFYFPQGGLLKSEEKYKFFFRHDGLDIDLFLISREWHGNSINLSEIELPKQITIEMVIELRKQYPNNLEFGDAFDKLLNN